MFIAFFGEEEREHHSRGGKEECMEGFKPPGVTAVGAWTRVQCSITGGGKDSGYRIDTAMY